MTLSVDQAIDTLKEIDQTEARSIEAFSSQFAAPHLILWGVIWLIGYGATAINPEWSKIWIIIAPLGGVLSGVIGFRSKNRDSQNVGPIIFALTATIFAFFLISFNMLAPLNENQVGAFIPMIIGLIYAVSGVAPGMKRMLILGASLITLTSIGYFFISEYFMAWMAIIGSGALFLGGLWMRRA